MIDPRFTNTGAVPVVPVYGAQQVPAQYHHYHRHHRHHKHKVRNDASPVSLDESIHKVDHNQPQYFQQTDGAVQGGGYGVPYGVAGYDTGAPYGAAASFYPQQQQQQQYGGVNYGYGNQYQGVSYGQGSYGGGGAPTGKKVKHHRRHHRHHRYHGAEAVNTGAEQAQAVPEQLIGQRSSSVVGSDAQQQQQQGNTLAQGELSSEPPSQHRHHHRHHHHHHSGERAGVEQTHRSHSSHHHTAAGGNGYGHINDELIFIERGDHSPHRQEPPAGYEYKGKIEVQNFDREITTHSQDQSAVAPPTSAGPCPPGWQQVVLGGSAYGPCPPGTVPYSGQGVGGGVGVGVGQAGVGGFGVGVGQAGVGGFGVGVGQAGVGGFGVGVGQAGVGGFGVGGYSFGSSSGGIISQGGSSSGGRFNTTESNVTRRTTIIEVWQKRSKSETGKESRSKSPQRSRTPQGPTFDFERFRSEILAAVERLVVREGPSTGTQTQIHPQPDRQTTIQVERIHEPGEVRVIVQPIQPVFYMPRQTETTTVPQVGPAPVPQQPTQSGAPQIVYIPRNVYVPVIKPVFVPRERVIVRPQIIHVARPVLVDRPVPVTQRPIIIDRERPVPVPVRTAQAAQAGGSKVVREEYVYRDNLPVAYGGRCAEFAGGVNYGYVPTQQEHQYANSSTHETGSLYQTQGQTVNLNVPNQFQQSQSNSYVEVQQGGGGGGSYHGSYSNLAGVGNAGAVNVGQLNQQVLQQTFEQSAQAAGGYGTGQVQVEILDTTVNPNWQKTDQSSLMNRYGRPAFQIVNQSKDVEQQMYSEISQRTSIGGVVRSGSNASFGSSSGIGYGGGGVAQY